MRALELRIPPPVVTLLCAGLMLLAARALPGWGWNTPTLQPLGIAIGIGGIALDVWSVLLFFRARTTINPLRPTNTSKVLQDGVYRYTRNPMYLGMLLLLLGFAIYLAHPLAFSVLPVFVVTITRLQIMPEERLLTIKFGAEYMSYMSRVRRWL